MLYLPFLRSGGWIVGVVDAFPNESHEISDDGRRIASTAVFAPRGERLAATTAVTPVGAGDRVGVLEAVFTLAVSWVPGTRGWGERGRHFQCDPKECDGIPASTTYKCQAK